MQLGKTTVNGKQVRKTRENRKTVGNKKVKWDYKKEEKSGKRLRIKG